MSYINRNYAPREFFALAAALCTTAQDEQTGFTIPQAVRTKDGRNFLLATLGECEGSSGVFVVFAYDDMNDEYVVWESEDDDWTWDRDWDENVEFVEPQRFPCISWLISYMLTGVVLKEYER